MIEVTVLLFNFTSEEWKTWQRQAGTLPGIHLVSVPKAAFGLTIQDILDGKRRSESVGDFSHRMMLIAGAPDPLIHFLLNVCRQSTQEPVLRAMLTETNSRWTCCELCEHLLEEEHNLNP